MSDKAKSIIKRYRSAVGRKSNWETLYEDALRYAAPHRETFDDNTIINPGQEKNGRGITYDSTASDSLNKFVSNLHSSLVPPMREFLRLKAGSQVEDPSSLEEPLEKITKILFSSLHNSNFDIQISESFADLAVGTGALLVHKGTEDKPFNFVNVPLSQLYLEEGVDGSVGGVYRISTQLNRNIERTWSDVVFNDDELKKEIEEKPDCKRRLIEATIPEKIEVFNPQTNETTEIDGWKYFVIDEKTKTIIVERDEKSNPWIVFRWSNLPGEVYGRGPLLTALPDIKTLNKVKEYLLKAASVNLSGVWTVMDDGVINPNNIKIVPGAVIPVGGNSGSPGGRSIESLMLSVDINLSQLIINDLQTNIKNMMFSDPLGRVDLPVKTATEMSLRSQEMAKRIGSSYGKLQYELLAPLVNRLLSILDDLGMIELGDFKVDGNIIAIEHISPLAMAQEEEEFVRIIRLVESISNFYGPEVTAEVIPADRFVTAIAPRLNVPAGIIPTEQEFEEMEQQKIAMQAAQLAAEAGSENV